jgi:hypothetical protein
MRSMDFGIIPVFRGLEGKLQLQRPIPFPSEAEAMRAGGVFAEVLGGAVAYSRVVDRDSGAVECGIIIGRFGAMVETGLDNAASVDLPPTALWLRRAQKVNRA